MSAADYRSPLFAAATTGSVYAPPPFNETLLPPPLYPLYPPNPNENKRLRNMSADVYGKIAAIYGKLQENSNIMPYNNIVKADKKLKELEEVARHYRSYVLEKQEESRRRRSDNAAAAAEAAAIEARRPHTPYHPNFHRRADPELLSSTLPGFGFDPYARARSAAKPKVDVGNLGHMNPARDRNLERMRVTGVGMNLPPIPKKTTVRGTKARRTRRTRRRRQN
jgi:hypothetical protein